MFKRWGWVALALAVVAVLASGFVGLAQDEDTPADAEAAPDESPLRWEEGVFVLLIIIIVMGGLVGFEYVNRRRRSLP